MSEKPTIILGLSGEAGAGKDAVGLILCQQHGFTRVAIGDSIRDSLIQISPTELFLYWVAPNPVYATIAVLMTRNPSQARALLYEKPTPPEIRDVLQWVGEFWRSSDPDFWVHKLMERIRELRCNGYRKFVVTDVRHPNERSGLSHMWEIHRPDNPHRLTGDAAQHISENAWRSMHADAIIANYGRLEDLEATVNAFVAYLGL